MTTLEIGANLGFGILRKELEGQAVVGAFAQAVEAEMAFGFVPRDAADGIVSPLAVEQAAIAVVAGGMIFFEAEDGPAGGDA